MKEIIEYLLASLVIISFIPVYAMINEVLYTPPAKTVSPLVLATYTEVIKSTLFNIGKEQVLDPNILDLGGIIANKVQDIYSTYGFHVDASSWLIKKIRVSPDSINVFVAEPGNLSLLIVHSDLSYDSVLLQDYFSRMNGYYTYSYTTSTTDIIAVAAILETGVAVCIDYWISNSTNIYRMYMANVDGALSILIPTDEPKPATTYYSGVGYVVYAHIYYYNYGRFYKYSNLHYTYIRDVYWYSRNYIVVNFNKSDIIYFGLDQGTTSINGKDYYRFDIINHYYDQLFRKTCSRITDNEWSCWGERVLWSPYIVDSRLTFPIYNTVIIVLKDSYGRIYIAQTYYNRFSFGDSIPENWPIKSISFVVRIGMIDYELNVTVWRRSL